MSEILYLVHRLPYPPNKGDKIRSFHILQYLARRHTVHVGAFLDDPADEAHVDELRKYCETVYTRPLPRARATARSLGGLFSGKALTLPYYFDRHFASWVEDLLGSRRISTILAFSSSMGQYALGPGMESYRRVMDFVDLDSDKWRQYALRSPQPMRWIYAREARKLAQFENRVADAFDAVVFVSEHETKSFAEQHPSSAGRRFSLANGVATDYFDPEIEFPVPFAAEAAPIVFTGMMNYWPNVDAVDWFAHAIFPRVRERVSNAEFWIVGAAPTQRVRGLASLPGVHVTGAVPDVRPYLKHAAVVVAPVRIARGVQNKVLEAMSMGKPVVAAPQAVQGLDGSSSAPVVVAESTEEFARQVVASMRDADGASTPSRNYVLKHYGWEDNLARLEEILGPGGSRDGESASASVNSTLRRTGSA